MCFILAHEHITLAVTITYYIHYINREPTKHIYTYDDLIEMMRDRDTALKRASKSKKEDDRKQARNIRNLVDHYVKRARSEFLKEQLENLETNQKSFGIY